VWNATSGGLLGLGKKGCRKKPAKQNERGTQGGLNAAKASFIKQFSTQCGKSPGGAGREKSVAKDQEGFGKNKKRKH